MSKQDFSREDWEEATAELRKEFDRRLREMEKQVRKGLASERSEIEDEGVNLDTIKENLKVARGRMAGAIQRGDQAVSDHPLLVVGGALAVGVLIGALIATKGRDD